MHTLLAQSSSAHQAANSASDDGNRRLNSLHLIWNRRHDGHSTPISSLNK
jgi:hypothetical protein